MSDYFLTINMAVVYYTDINIMHRVSVMDVPSN